MSSPNLLITPIPFPLRQSSSATETKFNSSRNGRIIAFDVLDLLIHETSLLNIQWPIYEPPTLQLSITSLLKPLTTTTTTTTIQYHSLMDFFSKETIYILPDVCKIQEILMEGPVLTFSYHELKLVQLARYYLTYFQDTSSKTETHCCPVILYLSSSSSSLRPLKEPTDGELYWLTWAEKLFLLCLILRSKNHIEINHTINLARSPTLPDNFPIKMSGIFRSLIHDLKFMDSTATNALISWIPARSPIERVYGNMYSGIINYLDLVYRIQRGMQIPPVTDTFRHYEMLNFFLLIYIQRSIRFYRNNAIPPHKHLGLVRTLLGWETSGKPLNKSIPPDMLQFIEAKPSRKELFEYLYDCMCQINKAVELGFDCVDLKMFGHEEKPYYFYEDLCESYAHIPKLNESWYVKLVSGYFLGATTTIAWKQYAVQYLTIPQAKDLLFYNYELGLQLQWFQIAEPRFVTVDGMDSHVDFIIRDHIAIQIQEYFQGMLQLLRFEDTPSIARHTLNKKISSKHNTLADSGILVADIYPNSVFISGPRLPLNAIQLLSYLLSRPMKELNAGILMHILFGLVHITRDIWNETQKTQPFLLHVIIALRILLLNQSLDLLIKDMLRMQIHAQNVFVFYTRYFRTSGESNVLQSSDISQFLITLLLFPFAEKIYTTTNSCTYINLCRLASGGTPIDDTYVPEDGQEKAQQFLRDNLGKFVLYDPTILYCSDDEIKIDQVMPEEMRNNVLEAFNREILESVADESTAKVLAINLIQNVSFHRIQLNITRQEYKQILLNQPGFIIAEEPPKHHLSQGYLSVDFPNKNETIIFLANDILKTKAAMASSYALIASMFNYPLQTRPILNSSVVKGFVFPEFERNGFPMNPVYVSFLSTLPKMRHYPQSNLLRSGSLAMSWLERNQPLDVKLQFEMHMARRSSPTSVIPNSIVKPRAPAQFPKLELAKKRTAADAYLEPLNPSSEEEESDSDAEMNSN